MAPIIFKILHLVAGCSFWYHSWLSDWLLFSLHKDAIAEAPLISNGMKGGERRERLAPKKIWLPLPLLNQHKASSSSYHTIYFLCYEIFHHHRHLLIDCYDSLVSDIIS